MSPTYNPFNSGNPSIPAILSIKFTETSKYFNCGITTLSFISSAVILAILPAIAYISSKLLVNVTAPAHVFPAAFKSSKLSLILVNMLCSTPSISFNSICLSKYSSAKHAVELLYNLSEKQ